MYYKKLIYSIMFTGMVWLSIGCIDTVTKNHVSKGSRIICRINAAGCTACAKCIDKCPEQAISEVELSTEWVIYIDPEKCTGCGECIDACEDKAINKVEFSD